MKKIATVMVLLLSLFITLNAKDIKKESSPESNTTWSNVKNCKSKIKCDGADCNSSVKFKCAKKDCAGKKTKCDSADCNSSVKFKCAKKDCAGKKTKCDNKDCKMKDCDGKNCKSDKMPKHPGMKCNAGKCGTDK